MNKKVLVIGLAVVIKLKLVDTTIYETESNSNSSSLYDKDANDGTWAAATKNEDRSKRALTEDYRLNFEKRLIQDLFENYQVKFGRPVNNMSEKVVVYFGVYLIQIIDLVNHFKLVFKNSCLS